MNAEQFKELYIGKIVRVTTHNKRIFYGRLAAVDDKSNLLLYETAAEIPEEMSHPINLALGNVLDDDLRKNRYLDMTGVSAEQAQKLVDEFPRNKYYFGPVMIAHTDIIKVEMQRKTLERPADPMPTKHSRKEKPKEEDKSIEESKPIEHPVTTETVQKNATTDVAAEAAKQPPS